MAISQVSTDMDGTTRPSGNGFDLGAFEFSTATTTAPAAPTNVRVVR
jgi:hypothetical protein